MQDSVVVDDWDHIRELNSQRERTHLAGSNAPTAVPGESCTQYSESALVKNLFQTLIASYLCPAASELPASAHRTDITYHSSMSLADR